MQVVSVQTAVIDMEEEDENCPQVIKTTNSQPIVIDLDDNDDDDGDVKLIDVRQSQNDSLVVFLRESPRRPSANNASTSSSAALSASTSSSANRSPSRYGTASTSGSSSSVGGGGVGQSTAHVSSSSAGLSNHPFVFHHEPSSVPRFQCRCNPHNLSHTDERDCMTKQVFIDAGLSGLIRPTSLVILTPSTSNYVPSYPPQINVNNSWGWRFE